MNNMYIDKFFSFWVQTKFYLIKRKGNAMQFRSTADFMNGTKQFSFVIKE